MDSFKKFTISKPVTPCLLYQTVCFPGKYFYTFTPALSLYL